MPHHCDNCGRPHHSPGVCSICKGPGGGKPVKDEDRSGGLVLLGIILFIVVMAAMGA